MSMSIAERMAMQARMKKTAGKTGQSQQTAGSAGIATSVADRMRKQAAYKAASYVPPKPTAVAEPHGTMTIAERVARAAAAKRREMTGGRGGSNQEVIAKYKAEYEKFLAKLETMDFGAMFFNPAAPAEKKEVPAEVAANVNGISTAEGEIVVEAVQAEPEGRVNEVPVTVPEEKPSRPKRTRKAKAKQEVEPAVVDSFQFP